nr:DUF2291 domain-containing protein [uncultured Caproiciproducens sp.]
MKKRILAITLILALACAALTGCVKVVPLTASSTAGGAAEGEGDAETYINGMFQKEAVPALKKKAVDFSKLMTEANGDLKTVVEKYGRHSEASSPYNFTVKGTATVEEAKTDLRAGYLVLKVTGYTGDAAVKMAVGPVFKGTSTRDSIEAIKFDDYKNQVTFAALSSAIHKNIAENVISKVKVNDLKGKTIDFYGTFANEQSDEILITPFEITVK